MTAKIGLKKYADHALVLLSWQKREKKSYAWRLNNLLFSQQENV